MGASVRVPFPESALVHVCRAEDLSVWVMVSGSRWMCPRSCPWGASAMCWPDTGQRSPTITECRRWGGTYWGSGMTWMLCRHRNTVGQMTDSSGLQNVTRSPCNSYTPRPIQGSVCFSVSFDLSWPYVLLGSTGCVEEMLWSFFF